MQKINFENKPSTNSPINADNLNLLQDNVEDAIDEVSDDIIYVEYTQNYSIDAGAGTRSRVTFQTTVPAGYVWVGYEIVSNGYVNSVINWIMSSTATNCLVAWYNLSDETYDNLNMTIRGIYKKI